MDYETLQTPSSVSRTTMPFKSKTIPSFMASYDKTSKTFNLEFHDEQCPDNNAIAVIADTTNGEAIINTIHSNKANKRMKKIVKSILKPRMEACKRMITVRDRLNKKLLQKHPEAELHVPTYDLGGAHF